MINTCPLRFAQQRSDLAFSEQLRALERCHVAMLSMDQATLIVMYHYFGNGSIMSSLMDGMTLVGLGRSL